MTYWDTETRTPAPTRRRGSEHRLAAQDATQDTQAEARPQSRADLDYARLLMDALLDRQAADVVLLDLSELTAFADAFVIATVDNIRQARALVDSLTNAAASAGHNVKTEGTPEDGWILADAGAGIFVHLFSIESRVYYDLEGLWHRAQEVVRIQ